MGSAPPEPRGAPAAAGSAREGGDSIRPPAGSRVRSTALSAVDRDPADRAEWGVLRAQLLDRVLARGRDAVEGGAHEVAEQRRRALGARLELRVELRRDEERVVGQ